jgi:hypothetical protein
VLDCWHFASHQLGAILELYHCLFWLCHTCIETLWRELRSHAETLLKLLIHHSERSSRSSNSKNHSFVVGPSHHLHTPDWSGCRGLPRYRCLFFLFVLERNFLQRFVTGAASALTKRLSSILDEELPWCSSSRGSDSHQKSDMIMVWQWRQWVEKGSLLCCHHQF